MSNREVYQKVNVAIETLSNLWESMLKMIQAVSAASASSLTVEPDLIQLQKVRKHYEQLLTSLRSTVNWLENNEIKAASSSNYKNIVLLEKEQAGLKEESERVTTQLKGMISQSYALQFQMEMFLSSSQKMSI
ncbi:hypothetical protein BDB01DRAFT_446075 [Pilobolus umbonatus]|nr:hypothetical protein BDB01DRAFT_446075 [Pilobolus umbonatus]